MRRIINTIAVALLIFTISSITFANTPVINHRQHNQQNRIANGAKSGNLTGREAARLEAEQAKIRRDEYRAKSDGEVSARERAKLNREMDKTNKNIYRQKHDKQSR